MSPAAAATRVLVVDDEPAIAQLLATALRYEGFDVTVAANGRQALECARAMTPVLILLDVMLPDLDGFETCRTLRGDGVWAPIIMLTARDAIEDRVRSARARGGAGLGLAVVRAIVEQAQAGLI